jgi:hypothetical protein
VWDCGVWQRVLLLVVAVGVIGMHTLGHMAADGMGGMSGMAASPVLRI